MPSIAIIGASQVDFRAKFGSSVVRVFADKGFKVYPIHPKAPDIEDRHKAYRSISEVPEANLDMVSLYLPPEVGIKVLPEIAKKGTKELWINPGAESPELVAAAEKLGLTVIEACSIVGVGSSPSSY